jgi:hypothetical protein
MHRPEVEIAGKRIGNAIASVIAPYVTNIDDASAARTKAEETIKVIIEDVVKVCSIQALIHEKMAPVICDMAHKDTVVSPKVSMSYAVNQLLNAANIVENDSKTFECQLVSDIRAIAAVLEKV